MPEIHLPIPVPCIDLHCHSTASDGLLPPEAVARRAVANGVEMLALTDHDTLEGLAVARHAAEEGGAQFINGVEISIEWGGLQVHIVGLHFDAANEALGAGLAAIRDGRRGRARRMATALEKTGIAGSFAGAMRYAENPASIGRSHFARYLIEIGLGKDMRSVFESYLVPGKPGYVEHRWASLAEAVGWIQGAGGVPVLAHPGRYKLSRSEMRRLLEEFKAFGGRAIEVVSGSHSAESMAVFARLTQEFGLLASCGSDFHGPEESYVDLGRLPPLAPELTPVWRAF